MPMEMMAKDLHVEVGIVSQQDSAIGKTEKTLQGISGRVLDLTVSIRPGNQQDLYQRFRMNVAKDGKWFTAIRYKPSAGTIRVDRTHSGFPHDIVNVREFPVRQINGEIKLRIVMDRYSLELFVNDGEQAASFTLYTPPEADAISFETDGAVLMDVEKYELRFDEERKDEI